MKHRAGETLPEFAIECVRAEAIKEWALILRDPNPIHLDPLAVKAIGLGDRVINQGPANVAYLVNMLLRAFPGAMLTAINSSFRDNVFAGDRLIAGGIVTRATDSLVQCDIWLRAASRDVVMSGTAEIRLP